MASASDARLFSASVLDVRIEPGHGPLIVLIGAPRSTLDETRRALAGAKGRLRSEVAAALQRKRAPDLSFVVVSTEISDDAEETEEDDAW